MHVNRSLTIKLMAAVTTVTLVLVCLFSIIQLFHFVQQRQIDYARQMESVAHTILQPLSEAVLRADIPQAERILNTLKPAGIIARADILLPDHLPALHNELIAEKPVPAFISSLFNLPVRITVPLYSPGRTLPGPLATLVLQADSSRICQFIRATAATMLIAFLLLALMLTIAITWCMNRLIVRPLRCIAQELEDLPSQNLLCHRLNMPDHHHDDEIGLLVRHYNHNQQRLRQVYDDMNHLTSIDITQREEELHRAVELLKHASSATLPPPSA